DARRPSAARQLSVGAKRGDDLMSRSGCIREHWRRRLCSPPPRLSEIIERVLRLATIIFVSALSVAAVSMAFPETAVVRVHSEMRPSVGLPRPTDAARA